ncbi:hypothetical protein HanXRQr2_Chr06g0255231 [Helianthus annuus]|uniref:Uncharacterized protein n=1 Tax=Helianthus annuus TaxID=4232 RepID=A0A9K3IS71_HELAN|nr:hypothetical protein HanXRQr2_Chr06g0255231 [Helianthus annuus]
MTDIGVIDGARHYTDLEHVRIRRRRTSLGRNSRPAYTSRHRALESEQPPPLSLSLSL